MKSKVASSRIQTVVSNTSINDIKNKLKYRPWMSYLCNFLLIIHKNFCIIILSNQRTEFFFMLILPGTSSSKDCCCKYDFTKS